MKTIIRGCLVYLVVFTLLFSWFVIGLRDDPFLGMFEKVGISVLWSGLVMVGWFIRGESK